MRVRINVELVLGILAFAQIRITVHLYCLIVGDKRYPILVRTVHPNASGAICDIASRAC